MITEDELVVVPETPVRELEQVGEALPLYLQEIGRVSLLSGPDEVRLAMAIEAGNLARERLRDDQDRHRTCIGRAVHFGDLRPFLSADEIEKLEDDVDAGERARRNLIEANLRLVVSV